MAAVGTLGGLMPKIAPLAVPLDVVLGALGVVGAATGRSSGLWGILARHLAHPVGFIDRTEGRTGRRGAIAPSGCDGWPGGAAIAGGRSAVMGVLVVEV